MLLIFLALLLCFAASAQTTKVIGQVIDSENGQPVPFAAVFFEGTMVGTSTDDDGNFTLSTRDLSLDRLCVQILGYQTLSQKVKPGVFSKMFFVIRPDTQALNEVRVKADNSKARKLLANIAANRDRNNPQKRARYDCDVYSKMEVDITNPREQLRGKAVRKQWSFLFDYVDTSDVSGVPYLPVFISETVSRRHHTASPLVDNEVITAHRISGADPGGNILTQFTGSTLLKNNFYDQFVNDFNIDIPSPICDGGLLFYNYYIIDSLQIDGRKAYHVRYHPKTGISSPAFDGEMLVDTEDWALLSIKAKLKKDGSVNWVRDMVLESRYQRLEDGTWFYKSNRMYADFSVFLSDSSKVMSFIGNRSLEFSAPLKDTTRVTMGDGPVVVNIDTVAQKDDAFWEAYRPYPLTAREKNIYAMVERVKTTDLYRTWHDIIKTLINNYYDIGPVALGPIIQTISYNKVEGVRLQLGLRTSDAWSKTDRISGYIGYGFKDKEVKGGMSYEHMFSHTPTSKLTLDAHYDMLQIGQGRELYSEENAFSSFFGETWASRPLPVIESSVMYDWEADASNNTNWKLMYREYKANSMVPMSAGGRAVKSIPSIEARARWRWSYEETVHRGPFVKTSLYTRFPVVVLTLTGGYSSLNFWDGNVPADVAYRPFLRPELKCVYKVTMGPAGRSKFRADVGTIIGRVPYTLLYLHASNGLFLLNTSAFSTMNFFEFASDSWATLMWEHNFHGFFLGKIPYIKKLQLREVALCRMTWGYLSGRNKGPNALVDFPEGMGEMGPVPFIEAGFGISNIFKLFRLDFIWRCTHRDGTQQKPRNFAVNFGLDLQF